MTTVIKRVVVIGGGLAGCECALQLAHGGVPVTLWEQKPVRRTEAQTGDGLAELVCSNSFRGAALENAVGLLKEEMRRLGSFVMHAGHAAEVPAGGAMAVDRDVFSQAMEALVAQAPLLTVRREPVDRVPDPEPGTAFVLATGPLTSGGLAGHLEQLVGGRLAFYDAIAPIIDAESIDTTVAFRAARYDKGGDDYLNLPMNRAEYDAFVAAVAAAETVTPHDFESPRYFEGCLPIETMVERGKDTLRFGPLKPVGLTDPRTGRRPWAVVQLRTENRAFTAYNMVGFQTRMKWGEQARVLRMIPGLANAAFLRFGSVHRNTFVHAPRVLAPDLSLNARPDVFLAGQITGVEGYVESAAVGLALAFGLRARVRAATVPPLPPTTALGAMLARLREPHADFQPSNVHFGMFAPLPDADDPKRAPKGAAKRVLFAARALGEIGEWVNAARDAGVGPVGPARRLLEAVVAA